MAHPGQKQSTREFIENLKRQVYLLELDLIACRRQLNHDPGPGRLGEFSRRTYHMK